MADVNANIGINFDTQQALASLRQLQAGLSRFNQSLTQGNVAAANAQKGLNAQLMQAINATGKFVATQKDVATSTSSFTSALEKNQLSMREYFRYTAAAATANTKTFGRMFSSEREILNRARKDRVKLLQSQYIQLGNANGELVKVLQVVPKHLQMTNGKYTEYATRVQMAAQRQQFLNQLLKQGSTQLLNFGKNTQWAGRQLMVGLTIPLSLLGSMASKTFLEMEQAVLKFERVYGDLTTTGDATNKALKNIQLLGKEFTKYGLAVKDTVEMAANAAAMGLTGNALNAQVIAATRLAVLGQIEQQQALETTISLQNAFGISSQDLANKINFLNAVENQTVLSIEDLTIAIPKAAPIVKQLGGSVEDLAFFLTAMKEGGINASEGANALKSGLASLINPAEKSAKFLAELGININGIVNANAGDLKGTVVGFARALDELDPLNRARAIEQMFGKFQFARLSTLFSNVTKDSSQAARALGLAGASIEELAILSERELKKVEDSTGAQFKKAMENLKNELVPVGKAFLEALTPVIKFVGGILEKFNNLSEGTKKAITIMIGVIGGLAPIALMTFGLLANGAANLIKFFALLRGGIAKLNGSNQVLGGGFDYLTNQQIENMAETNALHTSHNQLISTFNLEKSAIDSLAAAYGNASNQARALAASSPGLFNTVPGPAGAVSGLPKKFATGGVVPGTGNKDTVPSMLTPGEVVLTKKTVKDNPELVGGLLNGTIKQYNQSTNIEGGGFKPTGATGISNVEKMMAMNIESFAEEIGKLAKGKSQQTTIAEVKAELTKATERAGQDIADGIKRMLAEASQSVEKTTASWVKDKVRDENPATGKEFREPYSSKASTGGFVFAHGAKNANDRGETITSKDELNRLAGLTGDTESGLGRNLSLAAKNGGSAFGLSNFGFMVPEEANKKKKGSDGEFVMSKSESAELFTGPDAARTLSPILEEWARVQGITLEQAMTDPARAEQLSGVIDRYGSSIGEEINSIPGKFNEEAFYDAVERANARISEADSVLRSAVDNLLVESNFSVTTKDPKAKVVRSAVPQNATAMREDLGLPIETVLPDGKKIKPVSGYGGKNEKYLEIGGQIDQARADGSLIGAAVIDGIRSDAGTAAASPSKKAIKAGKEVAEGLALGMREGEAGVASQSSRLGSSAIPTAAETQARVDKMDLGNKAFYDDIDTPEMRDERQVLKSQDRQRRKLGATGTVDSAAQIGVPSQTSSSIISSSKRVADATEQLAVKTEEAVVAESQVVQQIRDQSKSRVTVKGNTINVGQARAEADRLDKEASAAEAAAAKVRTEAAKWEEVAAREGGKNMYTADNAKALKKKADEIEAKAAELRIKAAEADIKATQAESGLDVTEGSQTMSSGTVEEGDGLRRIVNDETAAQAEVSEEITDSLVNAGESSQVSADALSATSDNLVTQTGLSESIALTDAQRAQEAQETAITQAKINETKQAELKSAQENARQEAAAAAIPSGSQVDGPMAGEDGFVGPLTASQQANADRAQARIDRKKASSLKRGMRAERVSRVSGKAAGALGTAAMVAGMAGAPPQVTAALGSAAMVAQMAPMLAKMTGPQGILAAVVAVGAGLYLLNRHFTASARAQAKFVRDITATTDKMKQIGEFTGTVGASEVMAKRRESGTSTGYIARERQGQEFGINFAEGEIGKQMASSFVASMDKFGSEEAAKIFGLELAAYVADGVLSAEQAQGVAFAIASKFKDQNLVVGVEAQLSNIIGLSGEDLTRDPLELRLRLISESNNQVQRELDSMNNKAKNTTVSGADEAARVAAFQVSSVTMAQLAADSMEKYYDDEKRVLEEQLKQTTNKQEQLDIQTKLNKLIMDAADSSQIMNAELLKQINNNISQFDSQIRTGNVSMFNDMARRENAYFDSLKQSVTSAYAGSGMEKDAQRLLSRTAKVSDDAVKQGYKNNFETGVTAFDQGQDFEIKMNLLVANKMISPAQANTFLDLFEGNLPDLEATLDMGIQSRGAAKTSELLSLVSRFEDKDAARNMAVSITFEDNETFDRLNNILGLANQLDGKEIDIDSMFGGAKGDTALRVLDEQFKALTDQTDALKDEEITTDFLVNFDSNYGTDTSKADLDFIKQEFSGDKKGQVNALRTYEMISQYVNSIDFDSPEAKEMFNQEAERRLLQGFRNRDDRSQTLQEYREINFSLLLNEAESDFQLDKDGFIQTRFKAVIGTMPKIDSKKAPGDDIPGGGDKKNPLDFLDDLAMRIKNVRDGAFDATKPLESMLAAFTSKKAQKDASRMFDIFDGLQQRLIGLNVPKEFRDIINSMSADDFKELAKLTGKKAVFKFKKGQPRTKANIEGLTDTGRAVARTYREATLGDQNVINKETVVNIKNQEKAFRMLVASGVSATDALKQTEDVGVAAAIAMGALGKAGSKEFKQYAADLMKANVEAERFALTTKMIQANEEFKLLEQMPKLSTAMQLAGFSADQMAAVLNDPALARHLIEDLKDGKVDAKGIADYLNSIEAKKIIDIQVKFNAGQYSESARPGMDLVDEMFAVQENLLRTGADPRTTAMVDTMNANNKAIKEAEASAVIFRKQIELINREIEKDQRAIEEKYSRPIDDLSEQVNDLSRELEMNPLFGDRAMEKLNTENSMLSNDLALISNAAEKINEKYDAQAEALQEVSDINDKILSQQKGQLDLADALSKGDISASAQALQASRADSAGRLQTSASDALEQARKNEIDSLRGAQSGLSQEQIQDRQFEISQKIYSMETDPTRVAILDQIRIKQDEIYRLEELREAALLRIRDKEDLIYGIQTKQLQPLEDKIEDLTYANTLIQAQIDKLVDEQTVLDKTKLEWDRIKAKIDANTLAGKDFDAMLGALLASTTKIDEKWGEILKKLAAYSSTPVGVTTAKENVINTATADAKKVAEELAASQTGAKTDSAATAASAKAAADYAAAKASGDMNAAMIAAAKVIPSALALGESGAIGAASISSQLKAAEVALKASSASSIIAARRARDGYLAGGGMVPKYFNTGGFAMGTDTVPAMLTPGEFVMSKYAVQSYGVNKMKALNNGDSIGESVYNYNLSVNVKSDANPEDIARVVMTQIKSVDAQRIRGSRF